MTNHYAVYFYTELASYVGFYASVYATLMHVIATGLQS